jgi:hypothetical protein
MAATYLARHDDAHRGKLVEPPPSGTAEPVLTHRASAREHEPASGDRATA